METTQGAALWALRMILIYAGGRLTAAGYGDDALWQEVTGIALTIAGAAWSYLARRAQQREVPPAAAAVVTEVAAALPGLNGSVVVPPSIVGAARDIARRLA